MYTAFSRLTFKVKSEFEVCNYNSSKLHLRWLEGGFKKL